jgi:hypothetical protein
LARLQSNDSAVRLLEELPSRLSAANLLDPQGPQQKLPCEDEVAAAIEKLRTEKEAKKRKKG